MQHQTAENRRGEIHFRSFHADYVQQHLPFVSRLLSFRTEPLAHLLYDGVLRSPYLEIGAELCNNGLILENRLGVSGVAADLSRDALEVADIYRERLGMERLPVRVCCDAYRLPFRRDRFAVVFGWGTFHHFPDPTPIFAEARRVLHPDGAFFFDEEPIRRRLSLNLYNTNTPPDLTRAERVLDRLGLLKYVAVLGGKAEVDRGILEGTFRERDLRGHLAVFNEHALRFNPQLTGGIPSAGRLVRGLLRWLVGKENEPRASTVWFGGAVSGVARKHERGLAAGRGVAADEDGWALAGPAAVLVKKAPMHDRLVVVCSGADPETLSVSVEGACADVERGTEAGRAFVSCPIPADLRGRGIVSVRIDAPTGGARLAKVCLVSSAMPQSYFEHAPIGAATTRFDPARALGCPDCLSLSAGFVVDDFNRDALARVWGDAVSAGGADPVIDPRAAEPLLASDPFKSLDRSPLVEGDGEWRCPACGRRFPIHHDVLTLLPADTETELYGG